VSAAVAREGLLAVPREFAFAFVADYRNVPRWMYGVSRFDPCTAQTAGAGARFDTSFSGVGGTRALRLEATQWLDGTLLVLESVDEPLVTARFSFRDARAEATAIGVRISYPVPRGLAGLALGRVADLVVGAAVRHVEISLRRELAAAYTARRTAGPGESASGLPNHEPNNPNSIG
jgi:hypothetical protein